MPSAASAGLRSLSRSFTSPRKTFAPARTSASAPASERLSPTTSWPALSGLLRGRLREVSVLIEQRGETALVGTSLSLPLNHLLDAVVAEPGVTVTEIARRVGKSQQAMSRAADRLERLGFIERHVGAGRMVGLHATDAGRTASADGVHRELAAEECGATIAGCRRACAESLVPT